MAFSISITSDIAIQAADGTLVALVEIDNSKQMSGHIAAQTRHNLIEDSRATLWARYFLILSQNSGYLWDQDAPQMADDALPILQFSMIPVVEHYLPSFSARDHLMGSHIEAAASQWLWEIANDVAGRPREPERELEKAGDFLALVRGAQVVTERSV